MGIVNVTPDSFSDGGSLPDPASAVRHGLGLVADGADIVDVGGESTRPGAEFVDADTECRRVLPVVEGLAAEGILVSVDTSKPEVARRALDAGAEIVNDVRACREPGMAELVAEYGCGVVIMHMKGRPPGMQVDPRYRDVVSEVESFLAGRLEHLAGHGVERGRVAIDPGIGFGKTRAHNLRLLRALGRLAGHAPVLIGTSRKRFLGDLVGADRPQDRDLATAVTTALGYASGARVFRVHDVAASREALALAAAMVAR